jgi:hypothetical protein
LQSLPFNFATTLETVPAPIPYLHAIREQRRGSDRIASER